MVEQRTQIILFTKYFTRYNDLLTKKKKKLHDCNAFLISLWLKEVWFWVETQIQTEITINQSEFKLSINISKMH